MQGAPDISSIITQAEDEILSPESYVFVALMSVEEGPNKASFMVPHPLPGPAAAMLERQ